MRPVVDSDAAAERMRCEECGGLYRCDGEEHRYYTRADVAQPVKVPGPEWRDPMLTEANNTRDEAQRGHEGTEA